MQPVRRAAHNLKIFDFPVLLIQQLQTRFLLAAGDHWQWSFSVRTQHDRGLRGASALRLEHSVALAAAAQQQLVSRLKHKGIRKNCALYVIAEPDPAALSINSELSATVVWRLPVVYPDGSHDCEAVAVDAHEETVFLLTKRTQPPALYSLPLRRPLQGEPPAAELVARLTGIPQPSSLQKMFPTPTGRFRAQPTAMDISPDRQSAAVLTYGDTLLYHRRPGERWADTFSHAPEILAPHGLPQAEALCFSQDGLTLYVTGELKSPMLLRYRLPARTSQ